MSSILAKSSSSLSDTLALGQERLTVTGEMGDKGDARGDGELILRSKSRPVARGGGGVGGVPTPPLWN